MGTRPVLMIGEPELIKEMNIKDFHIFVDHNDITTGDTLNDRSLFNLFGDDWKKMRSIVSLFIIFIQYLEYCKFIKPILKL